MACLIYYYNRVALVLHSHVVTQKALHLHGASTESVCRTFISNSKSVFKEVLHDRHLRHATYPPRPETQLRIVTTLFKSFTSSYHTVIITSIRRAGAFVAGLDAGHAYNEFPLMGGQLVPAEYWALPGLRNFFENTAAVQFDHRVLAVTTLTSVATVWALHRRAPLPGGSKVLLHSLMAATALQVGLSLLLPESKL